MVNCARLAARISFLQRKEGEVKDARKSYLAWSCHPITCKTCQANASVMGRGEKYPARLLQSKSEQLIAFGSRHKVSEPLTREFIIYYLLLPDMPVWPARKLNDTWRRPINDSQIILLLTTRHEVYCVVTSWLEERMENLLLVLGPSQTVDAVGVGEVGALWVVLGGVTSASPSCCLAF